MAVVYERVAVQVVMVLPAGTLERKQDSITAYFKDGAQVEAANLDGYLAYVSPVLLGVYEEDPGNG